MQGQFNHFCKQMQIKTKVFLKAKKFQATGWNLLKSMERQIKENHNNI